MRAYWVAEDIDHHGLPTATFQWHDDSVFICEAEQFETPGVCKMSPLNGAHCGTKTYCRKSNAYVYAVLLWVEAVTSREYRYSR